MCYSSFTPDDCYMYLSFTLFHFINMSIVNVFLYEYKKKKLLTLLYIMLKNGQAYHKNLAVFKSKDF